ncbi:hypothetical protein RJ40_00160 [Methanofollis aquaemaris]|uniref:Transcriptional regulator n=1 Tax=Methanofollis aquaemaris TaxID=126734 RepID=A0A8A3S335_9EURY|nr:hypothetical protein [Methanofollis aquaemaris]QSZ66024.1 hypothetical protein RJ40_00160 [Methanofollis aquaemaris]
MKKIGSLNVQRYADLMPSEIRDAVAPLSDDMAWAIFMAILHHRNLRDSDFIEIFGSTFTAEGRRRLKKLEMAGLIEKKINSQDGACNTSDIHYVLSHPGRDLLDTLFGMILKNCSWTQ